MAKAKARNQQKQDGPLGYEAQLWQMADAFEERHPALRAEKANGAMSHGGKIKSVEQH